MAPLRRICVLAVLLGLGHANATAQTGAPEAEETSQDGSVATLQVETREVEISAFVQDKRGNSADNLSKDDFVLKEDGHEQSIRYFNHGLSRPLTLAVLVDTSGSQRSFVADEIRAAALFLESFINGGQNRATLVQFDRTVSQLGTLTNSPALLRRALPMLEEQVPQASPDPASSPAPYRPGSTVLYDAVYATAKTVLTGQTGRKAIVLITDGCDIGSRTTLPQAVDQAQRADAVIYSILYTSFAPGANGSFHCGRVPQMPGINPGLSVLQAFSQSTGGNVFTVSLNTPLRKVLAEVAQQIQSTYELAYTPASSVLPGTYHALQLSTRDKHYTVRARQGFYAHP